MGCSEGAYPILEHREISEDRQTHRLLERCDKGGVGELSERLSDLSSVLTTKSCSEAGDRIAKQFSVLEGRPLLGRWTVKKGKKIKSAAWVT